MAENNEEKPQLLPKLFDRATSFPEKWSQNLANAQNPAAMDAFEELVNGEDNGNEFRVREKNDYYKKMYDDPIQKTLSASKDSGIDELDVQGDGAHMEELPRASQSDPGSNTKLGHLKTERRQPVPAPRGRVYVMKNGDKCYEKVKTQRSHSTPVYINWPPPSQGQTSELPMSANDSRNVKLLADDSNHDNINNEASDKSKEPKYAEISIFSLGRSRLLTNSWQNCELRSIEEIESCGVIQTLEIFKKLQITRWDSLRMDGAALVGKDEKYFVSQGFTAFEARKLYKYVRGWRPKDQQQCKTDPSLITINKWSSGDVQTVMGSLDLPEVGKFAAANQVDGLLLLDLVENKYMIGIEKYYDVKLSLLEHEKLIIFLEEKRQEIGFLMAESIAKILEKLKLEKHFEAFKQQNIDSEKLKKMSESQLKEIECLTVFEARKLYKYVNQGWRPKKHDHCHKDLKTLPVDDWSVNDLRNYLQSIELEKLARFSCDNQIDGVMLRDLIDKKTYLESLEHDYGVKISLVEFKKLNEILREIQHE